MNRWIKVAVGVAVVAASGTAGAAASALHGKAAPHTVYRAAAVTPQTNPENLYVPVTPCRIIDTRLGGGVMKNGAVRNFYVAGTAGFPAQGGQSGGCGIPLSATAVAVSFKSVRPSADGYLHAWPDATAEPTATALSWTKGASLGDSTTLSIVPGPGLDISARVFKSDTNLTADVLGYYAPQIQALIGASGAIDSGTSRVVSVTHAGTGVYYVTLDRRARECVPAAITYNYGHYASVGLSSSETPNVVSVYAWNINNAGTPVLSDESFFFSVTC